MVGETVRVFENAAANHEAVNFGVFLVEFLGVGFGFDVAVDDEFSVGTNLASESDDFWDKLVVSGDLAHFFTGAEMDGKGGGMFVK